MKRISILLLPGFLFLVPGCITFRLSAEDDPSLKASGIGTAYVGYSGFDEWDGDIIKLGLFSGEGRRGEFFSLDIWPLGGVGVGVAGARLRVLPIEMGAGALLYKPRLPRRPDTIVQPYEPIEPPESPESPAPPESPATPDSPATPESPAPPEPAMEEPPPVEQEAGEKAGNAAGKKKN